MSIFKHEYRGFVVKLKPTEEQIKIFNDYSNASRFIYNTFLAYQNNAYDEFKNWKLISGNENKSSKDYFSETGKKSHYSEQDLQKLFTDNIDSVPWIKELNLNSASLREPIRDLEQAFSNYFNSLNGIRQGKAVEHPKFKKKSKTSPKFTVIYNASTAEVIKDNCFYFPSIGKVKAFNFDNIPKGARSKYKVKNITVKLDTDGCWYASIIYNDLIFKDTLLPKTGNKCGIDFGIKKFITIYDGNETKIIDLPKDKIIRLENRIKVLQRKLSSKITYAKLKAKELGLKFYTTNNIKQLKAKIAKLHNKIKNIRKNFQHVVSYNLVKNYDVIVIEDLNISGMLQNRRIAKAISRSAWHQFTTFISYKANIHEKAVKFAGRFYPSSKTCSSCGVVNSTLRMQKTWTCPSCATTHDRDVNASINLYNLA